MSIVNTSKEAIADKAKLPEFCLYMPGGKLWSIKYVEFVLLKKNREITEYRLSGQLNWETYHSIELQQLFRYDHDFFAAIPAEGLAAELPLSISLILAPECLPSLATEVSTAAQSVMYLQELSNKNPTHSLLSTDNWLLLSVHQKQPQGEVKYRTLWDYLDWSSISLDDSEQKADELLLDAIANFSKDEVARQLAADPNYSEANPQVTQATTQLIETLFNVAPSLLSEDKAPDEAPKEQFVNAIADFFTQSLRSQLTESLENALAQDPVELSAEQLSEPAIAFQPSSTQTIFETAVHFFKTQNWTVTPIPEQPILYFYFEGENGRWECYAQAREAQGQFIFYSVLPLKAPQAKYQAVIEYITRANYGMIIGNFEFDFSDGEIRFKTSLDINSSNLDVAVIGQLIYTNLFNVDKYLPGITQILDSDISPEEAIATIESEDAELNIN
jgi:hypothetical protein